MVACVQYRLLYANLILHSCSTSEYAMRISIYNLLRIKHIFFKRVWIDFPHLFSCSSHKMALWIGVLLLKCAKWNIIWQVGLQWVIVIELGLHTETLTITCYSLFLTLTVLVTTIDAQWEGMGDARSARCEPALLPPCPTIRVLSYSN